MNSCVLMVKIVNQPELRYTQDNQSANTQMLVQFEGNMANEAPSTLRAVSWGNLATEIAQKYSQGDQVILVGRLSVRSIDRSEGFKEKRAELVVSHIYPASDSAMSSEQTTNVVPMDFSKTKTPEPVSEFTPLEEARTSSSDEDLDDIPF